MLMKGIFVGLLRFLYLRFRFLKILEFNLRAWRDSKASRNIASRAGYIVLDRAIRQINHPAASNTLFILATGSSARQLGKTEYKIIRRNHSIGVNRWLMSDFVPDAISLDSTKLSNVLASGVSEKMEIMGERLALFAKKSPDLKILLQRTPAPSTSLQHYPIPIALRGSVFMYGRANLEGASETSIGRELTAILAGESGYSIPRNVLIDNGASVVRLIFLGISQKYDDIVLIGVDADDRPYFHGAQDKISNYFEPGVGEAHSTEDTVNRPVSTSSFIRELGAAMKSVNGPRLWVGSSESRLSDELAVYDWSL